MFINKNRTANIKGKN